MSKPSILLTLLALTLVLLGTAPWIGFGWGRARRPEPGIDVGATVRVLEEKPFLVPAGQMLVTTAVGSRLGSITEIGVSVDGAGRGHVWGDGLANSPLPFHALALAGQLVEVYGGLVQGDDAFALGYSMPAPQPSRPVQEPIGGR